MAIWLPAVDRRIHATVSNCGCVGYADSLHRGAGIQMEFCLWSLNRLFGSRADRLTGGDRPKLA
jgi:hypothetical protein